MPESSPFFDDLVHRILAGETIDFDALERARPKEREAIARAKAVATAFRSQGPSADAPKSLSEQLREKYGPGVDPEISLGGEAADPDAAESGASSELLRRLSQHRSEGSRYKLKGEVARGGMGAILRVWDADLRRHLAMKVILGRAEPVDTHATPPVDHKLLARFLEEAQVTGQLDHPGIVPVHELGLDQDGQVFFTMKLVKGRDLKAVFDLVFDEKEDWSETRALSVILRACEAMAYAHQKGVIHRDLKPANIMVGHFGEVYVMDWGLARVLGRKDTHDIRIAPEQMSALSSVKTERRDEREQLSDSPIITMDGDVMGTPAYMSPEQARGEIENLGPRSDVYSMGALLYHLLGRQAPYVPRGTRVSNRTVLGMVLQGPPTPLAELRKEVPAELVAIVEKAMSREASRRYADTVSLGNDLRAYLEHRVVGAYEAGGWAEAKKWVERNKPLAASLAAGVLLAVGGLTWVSVERSSAANALSKKNTDLAAATQTARANEKRATEQEGIATRRASELALATQAARLAAEESARQEALAKATLEDLLSLSAIQDLKDLEARADALWPADPQKVPAYEAWLSDARLLIEGQAEDKARGVKKRASLAEHEAKLSEIRQKAKPLTAEQRAQVESARQSSPRFAALEKARGELQWLRRMQGEDPWPSEAEVEAALASETLAPDAKSWNDLAWPLVDPDPAQVVYGSEVKALVLATRAVAAARESERAMYRDTLAWALYRTGRFDEARAEEQRAVSEIEGTKKAEYEGYLATLETAIDRWSSEAARAERRTDAAELADRVAAALERDVTESRPYEFEEGDARWWHAQLSTLVSDLKSFTDEKSGGLFSAGTSEKHGWGIVKRAEFARTIEERSVSGAEARRRWDEAIAAIGNNAQYGGLVLTPQIGLLPIGEDPHSHLWEFAHLQSGDEPERGADGRVKRDEQGRWALQPGTCIVLVLIPGGTFTMGAQKADPTGPNYDPQAGNDESPVHEVSLSAYFLSKYEMTQGQWERLSGMNPSGYGPSGYSKTWNREGHGWTALHPVEGVTWTACMELMERVGLELPSEAQWERAARAGTTSVYWTGDDLASLSGVANLSDAYGRSHGGEGWTAWEPDFDDGNTSHAEVGSYRANPYGLHDTHGNVWEWCRDGYDGYSATVQSDPVTPWIGSASRVGRGGSFDATASRARSALRNHDSPELQNLGLRPARASLLSASQLHPPGK